MALVAYCKAMELDVTNYLDMEKKYSQPKLFVLQHCLINDEFSVRH